MSRPADNADQPLPPWAPPQGGFHIETRRGWRRPLKRREVIANRILLPCVAVYCAVVFSVLPFSSLWGSAAEGALIGAVIGMIGYGPWKIGQILGVRSRAGAGGWQDRHQAS